MRSCEVMRGHAFGVVVVIDLEPVDHHGEVGGGGGVACVEPLLARDVHAAQAEEEGEHREQQHEGGPEEEVVARAWARVKASASARVRAGVRATTRCVQQKGSQAAGARRH